MKTLIIGIIFSISMTLSATELNKYRVPMSQNRTSNFVPKTRGVIPNPAVRSFIPKSPKTISTQEIRNIDKTIKILSEMDKSKVNQWLKTYQNKRDQAIETGRIKEARYYHTILTKWREKR